MTDQHQTTDAAPCECPRCGRIHRWLGTPPWAHPHLNDEQIAHELAERMRKDFGHDMRHEAGVRWLARSVAEIRHDCQTTAR